MKKVLFTILTILSLKSVAQNSADTTGRKMFNQALDFYTKGNLDSALILWTEIVDKKIGIDYDIYGNSFFNIPVIYVQKKDYGKAKEWFIKILNSDLKDNDETGNIMEPHTNYKHKSAVALARLANLDSNYYEVLQWLNKADTLYRYWGFEGSATSVSNNQAYLLNWKVHVLLKLNENEKAIKAILTELICSANLEDFFSTSEDKLLILIDKRSFKTEFDKAINSLIIQRIDDNNWMAFFVFHDMEYKIPISNIYPDRNLPHYWTIYFLDKNQTPNKEGMIEYIKQRSFYKRSAN